MTRTQLTWSRVFTTLLSCCLCMTLIAAGCEAPRGQHESFALRQADALPSAWAVEEGDIIAEALVEDPNFHAFLHGAASMLGDLYRAQQMLPYEEVEHIAQTLGEPGFAELFEPEELLSHLGGQPEDLFELRTQAETLLGVHGLANVAAVDLEYILGQAIADEMIQELLWNDILDELDANDQDADLPEGPSPATISCINACVRIHMVVVVVALGLFAVAVLLGVLTFPLGLIIIAIAVAALDRALADAAAELEACLATCDDAAPIPALCDDDSVCTPDEYCYKGFPGDWDNECRPKKAQGNTCSRDGKCLSGCCKYHLPSHPVSRVCRPASKCG